MVHTNRVFFSFTQSLLFGCVDTHVSKEKQDTLMAELNLSDTLNQLLHLFKPCGSVLLFRGRVQNPIYALFVKGPMIAKDAPDFHEQRSEAIWLLMFCARAHDALVLKLTLHIGSG